MYQPTARSAHPFLDEFEGALDGGQIPIRMFNDPELHERELDRIFTRAWLFVGHETEIPARGDYVHRYIGRDAFVLVRGEDGEIRLLFDSCRHRGAMVCRASKGNARASAARTTGGRTRTPASGSAHRSTGPPTGRTSTGGRWGCSTRRTSRACTDSSSRRSTPRLRRWRSTWGI